MDADLDPKKLTATFDVLLALDADSKDDDDAIGQDGEDDEEEEKKKKIAADKLAKDAEEKAEKKMEGAMDSFKKELRDADDARRAVRSIVGEVIAQDSAAEIYAFALDEMKVAHEGMTDVAGLKALFALAQSSRSASPVATIAQDAAGAASKFPNLSRFRQQ
jgi:hypothetical protein